jgi:hypothetical protein
VWRAARAAGETSLTWPEWRARQAEDATAEPNGETEEQSAEVKGEAITVNGKTLTRVPGQRRWEANLITLARKACDAVEELDRMVLKPTEPGLENLVRKAAAAFTKIADKLADASTPKGRAKAEPEANVVAG